MDNDSPFYKYYLKKVYYYEVSKAQPLRTNAIVRVLNDTRLADSLMTMVAEYQTVGEAQKADTLEVISHPIRRSVLPDIS